jgi:tetratricopeptide (TPR) repeat protein
MSGGEGTTNGGSGSGPIAEARTLYEQGRLDEALTRAQGVPGAESLHLQGAIWARKAESAPLPTPPPSQPGAARGAHAPRAPELKAEEIRAVELFDQAVQADARLAAAHLAAAELLAPHALRAFDEGATRGRRQAQAVDAQPGAGEPDWTPTGVLARFQRAAQADPTGKEPVEKLIAFAQRTAQWGEVDNAYRELIRRDRESAEPLVRYGDFLVEVRKEPLRAVEQYQQALIWRPDDQTVRSKVADVQIQLGVEHFQKREYLNAQVRFDEAAKYVKEPNSPQGLRLREYTARLREIRR